MVILSDHHVKANLGRLSFKRFGDYKGAPAAVPINGLNEIFRTHHPDRRYREIAVVVWRPLHVLFPFTRRIRGMTGVLVLASTLIVCGPASARDGLAETIARLTVQISHDPSNSALLLRRGELYRPHGSGRMRSRISTV
jgi:hypothetical protein